MTKPESITTSLEWSKKLEKAGWPQDSIYYWAVPYHPDKLESMMIGPALMQSQFYPQPDWGENFSAPTAEEILRRLPETLSNKSHHIYIDREDGWIVGYANQPAAHYVPKATDDTLANAAAAIWIYLKENNLLPND